MRAGKKRDWECVYESAVTASIEACHVPPPEPGILVLVIEQGRYQTSGFRCPVPHGRDVDPPFGLELRRLTVGVRPSKIQLPLMLIQRGE